MSKTIPIDLLQFLSFDVLWSKKAEPVGEGDPEVVIKLSLLNRPEEPTNPMVAFFNASPPPGFLVTAVSPGEPRAEGFIAQYGDLMEATDVALRCYSLVKRGVRAVEVEAELNGLEAPCG